MNTFIRQGRQFCNFVLVAAPVTSLDLLIATVGPRALLLRYLDLASH